MKLFIKPLAITAASLLLGTAVYGPKDTFIRAKALLSGIRNTANEASSSGHLITVAKGQLAGADDRLQEAEATLKLFRSRADKAQADVATLNDCIKVTQSRLALLQPVLKGEVPTFFFNGVNHSRAEAETEARRLLAVLEGHQKQAKIKNVEQEELRRAIATSDAQLSNARSEFDSKKTQIAELELKLTTEEAKAGIIAMATDTRNSLTAELSGGLSNTMNELQRRLAVNETRNARNATVFDNSGGTIAWGAETVSLTAAVDAAVGGNKVTAAPKQQDAAEAPKAETPKPTADSKSTEAAKPAPVAVPTAQASPAPAPSSLIRTPSAMVRFVSVPVASCGSRLIVSACGQY